MAIATIHHGQIPLLMSQPPPSIGPRGTLDSCVIEVLASRENWMDDVEELGFSYDQKVTSLGHAMWVQSMEPEEENNLVCKVRIPCIGLYRPGDKRKRLLNAAGKEIAIGPYEKVIFVWSTEEQAKDPKTGDPIAKGYRRIPKVKETGSDAEKGEVDYKMITTPSGSYDRWNVRDAILTVTDRYFTTTRPNTTVIGTHIIPPSPPEPPPYIWGGYTEPLRGNHPNGWVLDDRRVEEHFADGDTGLWEVEDVSAYYYTQTPD